MEENRNDIITRINEKFASMSKSHKKVATYIQEHYDQAVFMTAAQLGKELDISESTVVRFAMAIGFEGYPEFQKELVGCVKKKLSTLQKMDIKYVITLDADTYLYLESAKKLICAMEHPFNKPVIKNGLVVKGYGIIQPRVNVDIESTNKSIYSQKIPLFSIPTNLLRIKYITASAFCQRHAMHNI